MEKGFLLYWVTLDGANIFPGHIKCSTLVVSYFTYPGVAVWDGAAMPTGKASDTIPLNRLVEFTFPDVLIQDFAEGGHGRASMTILEQRGRESSYSGALPMWWLCSHCSACFCSAVIWAGLKRAALFMTITGAVSSPPAFASDAQ